MDDIVIYIVGAVILLIVLPIAAIIKAVVAGRMVDDLQAKVSELENQVHLLQQPASPSTTPPLHPESGMAAQPATVTPPAAREAAIPSPAPAPIKPVSAPRPAFVPAETFAKHGTETAAPAKAQPVAQALVNAPSSAKPAAPDNGWEQFMGAKLFAWIGGLALFFGIAFFVKYSFDHNLVPPEARVAIGFAAGLGLLVGGMLMKRKENVVTAQTLCATGILVLYAVTYACRSYYHFAFFGVVPTFVIMALVTCIAFLLSVRMNAPAVAVLGVAGGFLTPVLLSTGQDYPLGLFGYIALLDIGLLAIARRRGWKVLPALGAIGTVLTQVE